MKITNDSQINSEAAKWLREQSGLSQRQFWAPYGTSQSGGWRYENGAAIPPAIRTLIFARHIAGLALDTSTDAGAAEVVRVGMLAAADAHAQEAKRLLSEINQ